MKNKTKSLILTVFAIVGVYFSSCSFFSSFNEKTDDSIKITALALNKQELNTKVGEMEYLSISIKPVNVQKDVTLKWTYDSSVIECDTSSNWGVTIKAVAEGQTSLRCSYDGYDASCLIKVTGYAENYEVITEPYIYSNYSILQTSPGVSEKVFVSLYGGDASDIGGYTWTIDNSSVANIQPTGQYCMITAKESGYARIKITHNKASYPYYIGVYVFADATEVGYITTSNNIVTMNQEDGEQTISVNLVNGKDTSSDSQFDWKIISEEDSEIPVGISWNGNKAVLTPLKSGSCTIKVTHPDATYPLEILCRVITIIKNVYIQPDNTVVTLSGETTQTVTCDLENINSGEYNIDGFSFDLDQAGVAEIISFIGNQVTLKGIANGSCKLIISHEKAAYSREVLLIVNGQAKEAVDASCFITTSQNYIRTKVGAEGTTVKISLKGGEDGDENDFTWTVKSTAADDSDNEVINLDTSNGKASYSRAATLTYAYGTAFIEPLYEGTAVITITHPKIVYPTEILVKVLNKEAILEEPLYFTGSGLIKIINGENTTYTVELKGNNKSSADDNNIKWDCDSSLLQITPNANIATIQAPSMGTGSTISYLTISHNKAEADKKVLIMTADDIETLNSMKALYSDKTYYNLDLHQTVLCTLNTAGFAEGYDFTALKWTVKDSTVISVEKSSINPLNCSITALKAGITTLTANIDGITCDFTITVYPAGAVAIEKEVYFTTSQNVITFGNSGLSTTAYVSAINLESSKYSGITWTSSDDSVAKVIGNGITGTISSEKEGEAVIEILHPDSQNTLKIYVRVGSEYVIPETPPVESSCYITTDQNYIRTKVGAEGTTVKISLKGGTDGDEKDFTWTIKHATADGSNNKIINLDTSHGTVFNSRTSSVIYAYGTAFIEPLYEGTAVITISHPKCPYPTDILVKVLGKDSVLEEPLYFTGDGLVQIVNGETKTITVELKGINKAKGDDNAIKWKSDNDLLKLTPNANIATIQAPSKGSGCTTSYITISHNKAESDKKILVMTADNAEVFTSMKALYSDKTYYNLEFNQTVSCIVNTTGFEKNYDFDLIKWTVKDPSVIYAEKSFENPLICSVTALKAGTTTLTASIENVNCDFNVTVFPEGITVPEKEIYLTTAQNVIDLGDSGLSTKVSVTAVNLDPSKYSDINWSCNNENVAKVIGNGTTGTITSVTEGEAVITVSHADSQNSLKIYVRVSSEIIIPEEESLIYISSQDVMTFLKGGTSQQLKAVLINGPETAEGFSFEIDNSSVASISAQSPNGIAYIKPVSSGQAQVTIKSELTSITKKVLIVVGNSAEELAGFTYLTTSSNVVALGEGSTKNVSVSVKNSDEPILDGYTWTTSNPAIVDVTSSGATAVFTGNAIGTALIKVTNKACQYSLTIIAQVVDPIAAAANPYIQLSSSVITVPVSTGYTSVTADLIGGTENDYSGFIWKVSDSSVCAVYGQNEIGKIKALSSGQTYITVSHPKAAYSAQLLVVCDDVPTTDCYISVPSSIINIKPTDSAQTITASLVNGTSTDKYTFNWSLDVYDVIDFQYSANVCTITPKQTGSATITISHPKAAYNQQIIVNVQEYSNFSFPQDSITITQGTTSFVNMQVPTTTLSTHVEYSVENSKICSISGTRAVAQLTGVGSGTTTVHAKLIASSTGVVQATTEMLVYVKEASVNTIYITSSSTITTINKGKSQSLTATLTGTGISVSDQSSLKWTTKDTDIIQITGIKTDGSVFGQSIYVTAKNPGEALITCSHEKAASTLQFYVVVPGTAEKSISLNKTYLTLTKGSSGSQLKATITNSTSTNDYADIEWSCDKVNGKEIARVMGNGQTVTIYPLNTGETTVKAQLTDNKSVAKCTVIVEAGKSFTFETNSKKVEPLQSKTVKYTVSPPDAVLTWTDSQDDDYFTFRDTGCNSEGVGYVEITGIKEGNGTLACVTDGGVKGSLSVRIGWEYDFTLTGSTTFSIKPTETKEISYSVHPADGLINISSTDENTIFEYEVKNNGNGTGTIKIKPITESSGNVTINVSALNPNNHNELIGSHTITAKFQYDSLTPIISAGTVNGKYSYWNSGGQILTLGDGESISMKFDIAETKASGKISNVTFQSASGANSGIEAKYTSGADKYQIYTIEHPTDIQESVYRITQAYVPTYKGNKILDWETSLSWWKECDHGKDYYHDYFGLVSKTYSSRSIDYTQYSSLFDADYADWLILYNDKDPPVKSYGSNYSKVLEPSLVDKIYSQEAFKKIAWFYCPGTPYEADCDRFVTYPVAVVGATGTGNTITLEEGIMSENVSAVLETTKDTTVQSGSGLVGYLVITITHVGKTQTSQTRIPVYLEIRNCNKNYK